MVYVEQEVKRKKQTLKLHKPHSDCKVSITCQTAVRMRNIIMFSFFSKKQILTLLFRELGEEL
jgi:hypothetical protein